MIQVCSWSWNEGGPMDMPHRRGTECPLLSSWDGRGSRLSARLRRFEKGECFGSDALPPQCNRQCLEQSSDPRIQWLLRHIERSGDVGHRKALVLSLIHISEPTRLLS